MKNKIFLIAFIAFIAFLLNIKVFNKFPFLLESELEIIGLFDKQDKSNIHEKFRKEVSIGLVNIDLDISLRQPFNSHPEHFEPKEAIIDREKIISFLKGMQKNSALSKNIDLVVLDVELLADDSTVINEIQRTESLIGAEFIVVATVDSKLNINTANPSIESFNGFLYSFEGRNEGAGEYNVPFYMYKKVSEKLNQTGWKSRSQYNSFIPIMYFSDETLFPSYGLVEEESYSFFSRILKLNNFLKVRGKAPFLFNELGILINDEYLFKDYLNRIVKSEAQSKIIFLGSFENKSNDYHNTYKGEMHGSTILINLFYNLMNENNHLGYVLLLLIYLTFFFLTYLTFSKKHFLEKISSIEIKPKIKILAYFVFPLKLVLTLIDDFLEFWVLIIVGLSFYLFFDYFINVSAFLVIFFLIKYSNLLVIKLKEDSNKS